MFCSKCGKTIPTGVQACPNCGMVLEGLDFSSGSYIGTMPKLDEKGLPRIDPNTARPRYISVKTTTMGPETNSDVFRNSIYRPALHIDEQPEPEEESAGETEQPEQAEQPAQDGQAESAPEDSDQTQDPQEELYEELPENMRARPLEDVVLPGISEQLRRFMIQDGFLTETPEEEQPAEEQPAYEEGPDAADTVAPTDEEKYAAEEAGEQATDAAAEEQTAVEEPAVEAPQSSVYDPYADDAPQKPARPVVSALFSSKGRAAGTRVPKREYIPEEEPVDADDESDEDRSILGKLNGWLASVPVLNRLVKEEPEETDEDDYEEDAEAAAEEAASEDIYAESEAVPAENEYEESEEEYEEAPAEAAVDTEAAEEAVPAEDPYTYDADYADDETYADDIPAEEDDDEEPRGFHLPFMNADHESSSPSLMKIAIIVLCAVIVFGAGFVIYSLRSAADSPVSGVTHSFFQQGIELIRSHNTDSYRDSMAILYGQDQTGTALNNRQLQDTEEIRALIPGTPLSNDESFLNALLDIQSNIDSAVMLDVLGIDTGASSTRWKAIDDAIEVLAASENAATFSTVKEISTVEATPEPQPTATVSPYKTLTKGMSDDPDVKKMQSRLYELGWFNDVRDGDFGSVTQKAVKQFQEAVGLSVTGIADGETLAAIYAEDAPRTGSRITPAPVQ